MHRLRCLVVIGALGMAASVVAAGPAAAAKGGNSDNAHACQQGGHTGLTDAGGSTFKNAGACASNGAKGNTYASSLSVVPGTYRCANNAHHTCWGTVTGTGLASPVDVIVDESHTSVNVGMNNSVNARLELDCLVDDGAVVSASAHTTSGAVISTSSVLVDCD